MQSKALREVERHSAMPSGWTGFTACRENITAIQPGKTRNPAYGMA